MEYCDLIKDPEYKEAWFLSGANELGRLAQGVGDRIKGTSTIFFINKSQVPTGRTVTYARSYAPYDQRKMNQTELASLSAATSSLTTQAIPALKQQALKQSKYIGTLSCQ